MRARTVSPVVDASQSLLDQAQFLGVSPVLIQEEPFLLALLRHIAVVAGGFPVGYHGSGSGAHLVFQHASLLLQLELLLFARLVRCGLGRCFSHMFLARDRRHLGNAAIRLVALYQQFGLYGAASALPETNASRPVGPARKLRR